MTLLPEQKLSDWTGDTAEARVIKCRAFLRMWSFLSEVENHRIDVRVRKWVHDNKQKARKK